MPTNTRRRLLQGLTVMLPAAWTRPVVESVILPAHAQTSGPRCSAAAACYSTFIAGLEENRSFNWPGGGGAQTLEIHDGFDCSGEVLRTTQVVFAESLAAAEELAGNCPSGQVMQEVPVSSAAGVPPLPDGCSFYWCEIIN